MCRISGARRWRGRPSRAARRPSLRGGAGALLLAAALSACAGAAGDVPRDREGRAVPADRFACADPLVDGLMVDPVREPVPGSATLAARDGAAGAPPVTGAVCRIARPVKARALGGIAISEPALLDCAMARRLAAWLKDVADPVALRILGSRIAEVRSFGAYSCRPVNNRAGSALSQHAFGRAFDVGGFTLADGRRISVLGDWGRGDAGIFLAQIRRQACAMFRTVLGPGSDRFHTDHLHVDLAPRAGPAYCR
ncbi:MAG: extensin family protein [Pseudomonadota bacterium]